MWRSKKFITTIALVAVVLVGSTVGVVLAQDNGDDSQPKTLLTRVAGILGIEQQNIEDAFAQARSEMQSEALQNYLDKLVEEGTITQEEADEYSAWLQSRPDISLPAPFGHFGGHGFHGDIKRGGARYFGGK